MLFNSFGFLILFLPLVLAISLRLRGQWLLRFLALASFVFYAFAGHAWFIIPMLVTTVLDFYMAQFIARNHKRGRKKIFLGISLIGNLGLLCYFKYSGLILKTAEAAASKFAALTGHADPMLTLDAFTVILPAGISFYTFQTLAYIIDVYRRKAKAERNFWRFACFVSFFPHLVAGPLTRHNQLIPQLTSIARSGIRPRWEEGIYLFSIGLAKKVLIGDRISVLVHPLLENGEMSMTTAWLALLGFTLQIYFDFSGYSDMAIGLGRMFGIELPQNFNSPYKATSPADFWRRWHITLSRWLRDYLYITLGGNRCSTARRYLNIMLTMVIGGLWHGASWTFAVWGLYHGALLVMYHVFERQWDRMNTALQRILTLLLISIGWVFFRAPSWDAAEQWLFKLVDIASLSLPAGGELKLVLLDGFALALTQCFPAASARNDLARIPAWQKFSLGIIALAAVLMMNYSSRFLYFQF